MVDIDKTELLKKLIAQREEDEEKVLREGYLNFKPPRACGYNVIVKLYLEEGEVQYIRHPDGSQSLVQKPESIKDEEKWQTIVGRVVSRGPSAYKGQNGKYDLSGAWCDIGDWIMFSPYEATKFVYRGVKMYIMYDDRPKLVVEDPSYIKRY